MKKLSTQAYKGTRDFYPKEKFIQNYIFAVMSNTSEQFGYEEYNASLLEYTEIYKAKTGEEIVNGQTYSFIDRGDRDVTIRPEMTPTVARMIAAKRKELTFPVRWFSIPNLFRYEKPQRGRLREHWQLNADIIGVDGIEADAEIILLASQVMENFEANPESFGIRINSRKIINSLLNDYLKLNEDQSHQTTKLIDRKDKMPTDVFTEKLEGIISSENSTKLIELLTLVEQKGIDALPKSLLETDGCQDLIKLFTLLEKLGVMNYKFELTLMRGFDYYTGMIFEVFDTNPINKRSLFGGGRYDGLVGIFDAEPIAAVGFGMGDVTIQDYLETYNLLPEYHGPADLYLCPLDSSFSTVAQQLAQEFRLNDINVSVDLTSRKIASQIKTASKKNIPFVICLGEQEAESQEFKLKNLITHEETVVNFKQAIEIISKYQDNE